RPCRAAERPEWQLVVVVVASEYAGRTTRVPPHALALTSEGAEDADAGAAATIPDPRRISELNSSPVTRVLVRRRAVSSKEKADISSFSCAVYSGQRCASFIRTPPPRLQGNFPLPFFVVTLSESKVFLFV